MKKSNLNKVFTGLLAFMLAIFSFTFIACSDGDVRVYPTEEQKKPQVLTNTIGTLLYEDKQWIIRPEGMSIESSIIMIIKNMKEEYEEFEGKRVNFSGVSTTLYYIKDDSFNNFGYREIYQSLELTAIELFTESRSVTSEEENICGTPSPEPPLWYFTRTDNGMYWDRTHTFRIYTHFIRNAAGNRNINKEQETNNIISKLNSYYAETSISFTSIGSEYIDSDLYCNLTRETCSLIFGVNAHTDAIDIYIFEGDKLGNLLGKANNIPSTACLLKNENEINTFTLPHEVGHCLGLYHTHHGTAINDYYEGGTAELVNGSNSETAGDFIIDTPADPCEWGLGVYVGTGKDANGDSYHPDPLNVMSYSYHWNVNKFTQKQIERIHQTISMTPSLESARQFSTHQISGPDYITTQANYSVNVPSGYIVDWDISCWTYTNKTSNPTVTQQTIKNNPSITLTNANPQAYSQRFELKATITTPTKGYKFYLFKRVYHVLCSSATGTLTWGSESSMGNHLGTINLAAPNTSSPIKVYQGGKLTFKYTDVCGANSNDDISVFDFNVYSPSTITKVPNSNHAFTCANYPPPSTSNNLMLSFTYSGTSTFMQIPIQILAGAKTLNTDSLELEKIKIPNNNKVIVKQ